ncbi:uncharacterized protein A4U43_C07F20190 [Asparagus officinalis]|uniref:Uncharacterized protein n=1 Tax=Asparagus officinalis TaxID=4686 RepID=A0A5P1EGT7_ASPOF|nr:uncharacterized protein A4U43_C07F20190 [Asparagus officinalis]
MWTPLAEPQERQLARPTKRLRQDLASGEAATACEQVVDVLTRSARLATSVAPAEKTKKVPHKISRGGPGRAAEGGEAEVIHLYEGSLAQEEGEEAYCEARVKIEAYIEEEGASIDPAESAHRWGKEPIEEETFPIGGSPLRAHHQPCCHLDVRGSVLESRMAQIRAMEQFWLPRDVEILENVPNVDLHKALQSYLVCKTFVEQELFGRMEKIRTSYLKLQEEVEARQANMGGDLKEALKELSAKEQELGDW